MKKVLLANLVVAVGFLVLWSLVTAVHVYVYRLTSSYLLHASWVLLFAGFLVANRGLLRSKARFLRYPAVLLLSAVLATGWLLVSLVSGVFLQSTLEHARRRPYELSEKVRFKQPFWRDGHCFLRVRMPARCPHGDQVFYVVYPEIKGTDILLSAGSTYPPVSPWRTLREELDLGAPQPGMYQVVFLEPNGTRHALGEAVIGWPE